MSTTIRAVRGFFVRDDSMCDADTTTTPRLFKKFALATTSWSELAQRVAAANAQPERELKVVYLVRHAEGMHNAMEREIGTVRWETEVAKTDAFLDADLTPFGAQDARSKGPLALAAERARGMPPIERVVVSPLSRAIQTAELFFATSDATSPLQPFVAMELCREILGVHTCDKRVTRSALQRKFPYVDFAAAGAGAVCDELDVLWTPTHRETDAEIRTRAQRFLVQLFDAVHEQHVAIATHSKFMRILYDLVLPGEADVYPANCEVIPLILERVAVDTATVATSRS